MSSIDAGVCLLALRIFREHGLPCRLSEADILALRGVDISDQDAVIEATFHHEHQAQSYFVDGMMQHRPEPPPPF